jgi:hypothetical protein
MVAHDSETCTNDITRKGEGRNGTGFYMSQAVFGLIPGSRDSLLELSGSVVNINVPKGVPHGFYLAHQGAACVYPAFKETFVQTGPPDEEGRRRFRNTGGDMRW